MEVFSASNLINSNGIVNNNQQIYNNIKGSGSQKEQLKKVAEEFESVFVTKMMNMMDKTVDREGGIFGGESKYVDTFKSHVYQEIGREFSKGPNTTIGFAKQIYEQMEKYTK